MLRSIALASFLLPALAGCTHASAGAPAPGSAALRPPEPPPIAVAYRLVGTGAGEGVLLAGRTQVDAHHGAVVHALAAHSSAGQALDLDARPRDDGTVLVDVRYEETTAEGARLKWLPAVRLARGVPARAEVSASGWGRAIELTAE
jgi:hypothetical protein